MRSLGLSIVMGLGLWACGAPRPDAGSLQPGSVDALVEYVSGCELATLTACVEQKIQQQAVVSQFM